MDNGRAGNSEGGQIGNQVKRMQPEGAGRRGRVQVSNRGQSGLAGRGRNHNVRVRGRIFCRKRGSGLKDGEGQGETEGGASVSEGEEEKVDPWQAATSVPAHTLSGAKLWPTERSSDSGTDPPENHSAVFHP